jgi:hypothetical protein
MGAAIIAWSLIQVNPFPSADQLQIVVGLAIATLAGLFPVRIPRSKLSVAKANGKARYAMFNAELKG